MQKFYFQAEVTTAGHSSTTQSVVTTTTSTATASLATTTVTTPSQSGSRSSSYSAARASTPTLDMGPKRQKRLIDVEEIDFEDDIHGDILDATLPDATMDVDDGETSIIMILLLSIDYH